MSQDEKPDDDKLQRLLKAAGREDQRKNIYTCTTCFGHVVTRDVDEGVTPFMIPCEADLNCDGKMESSFYRVADQRIKQSHEWYKPGALEIGQLPRGHLDHVEKGGLLLRRADGLPLLAVRRRGQNS